MYNAMTIINNILYNLCTIGTHICSNSDLLIKIITFSVKI